ncbi:LuxR C-terminal-related transcriptional regulator [Microbacterium sp. VKM Ac-2923]|uniref:LuxR C-terminal-related transcriptional regulator n=1 Tax=Microbacterium sp. VKM Ac-2923 TaxID=2929476 RepID=UPI001FB2C88B|nr:LuxR C-terminal-related transcriptional regulator [Microbacterium sp. VKM Ac-2923]MCJ1706409.1 LuxR C-terminal-related transcriptional regulator [Microbacterium sp. VKM Ac-2923]
MLIDVDTVPTGVRAIRRISRFWAPRAEPLTLLHDALSSDVVLLRGPAGVGKTSLLRQFAASLDDDADRGVQFIDGSRTTPESMPRILAAFGEGPSAHVLLIDNHIEGTGLSTEHVLHLLRSDSNLQIVVATRQATGLESPLVALEFDVQVIPAERLLMTRDDLADVLALNGVATTEVGIDALAERTHGWPALVQLASARLRLEGMPLRTRDEATAVAEYANAAFTSDLEHRLDVPVSDDVRLLAVAPHVTVAIADAMGVDPTEGSTGELVAHLQDAGFMWPSSTRLTLAQPIREQWLREITARRPDDVAHARLRLLAHLVAGGEPLLAAQLAADAEQWATLAGVLRSSGPEIWARDPDGFDRLVALLRTRGPVTPVIVDALLALDPATATSLDTPGLVVAALGQLPDAKSAASGNPDALILRVSLLRAAGRFALATEAASLLTDVVRRSRDLSAEMVCEAWYQIGMTSFAMGRLRDARMALDQAERAAPPARRMRARGAIAVIDLLEGDIRGAQQVVAPDRDDNWRSSPWGEGIRLAEAWLSLEAGDAAGARALFDRLPATEGARELWPFAAGVHAVSFLLSGSASDALGLLRTWMTRARSTPPSHFQSTQILTARAKVLIALRQARKALSLFEGPFALASTTAPAIALSQLYAGRAHEAFVMSVKWGLHHEPSPRAALESLVVSVIADVRLNGDAAHRTAAQRAEALSARHDLWSPWSAVAPEDRGLVLQMLSPASREEITRRCSFFASSVSVPHLTKREQVVLAHLTPASTIADIARALVVSPNTVKTQLQSLYRKLEVSDRSSAIRAAHAWGLIESDPEG